MPAARAYARNMKLLKWLFALINTPLSFFAVIYFYQVTGSYFITGNLIVLGALSHAVMEVPTGIISDKFLGRKGSFIAGAVCLSLTFAFYILGSINYLFLIPARIFFGMGKAFNSGNTTSLLYDTLRDGGREKDYHKVFSKHQVRQYFYRSFSLFVAGVLAKYFGVIVVVYYCLVQRLITVFLGMFLKEPRSHREHTKSYNLNTLQHLKAACREFRNNRHLFFMGLTRVFKNGFMFGLDRFNGPFYKQFLPFDVFGALLGVSLFVHAYIAKYSERITRKIGYLKTFLYIEYFTVPLQIIAYLFPGIHSPFLLETSSQTIPISRITESAILHRNFTNEQRATMESLIEIVRTVFLALFTALLGYLADAWTLSYALLFGASCRILVVPLLYCAFRDE